MQIDNRSEFFKSKIMRTLIAAVSFFFLLGSYYVIKSTRKPLLFEYVGKSYLHHYYNISAAVTFIAIIGYNQLVNRLPRTKLLRALYAIVIGTFLLMALGFQWIGKNPAYDAAFTTFYFFFVSLYVLFMMALFWSFNHDIHKTGEAKKFYPYIFLGGQIGIVAAGKFTSWFVSNDYSELFGLNKYSTLLIISTLSLAVAWAFLEIFKTFDPDLEQNTHAKPTETGTIEDFKLFKNNRYVLYLGLIVVLATFTSTISDLQFSWLMDDSILKDSAFYQVKTDDMQDKNNFVLELKNQKDPVSKYVYNQFSPKTQKNIQENTMEDAEWEIALAELNIILQKPLYDQNRFELFTLPDALQNFLTQSPEKRTSTIEKLLTSEESQKTEHVFMLNKLLLSEVYQYNFLTFTPKQIKDKNITQKLYSEKTPLSAYLVSKISTKKANHEVDESIKVAYFLSELIKQDTLYDSEYFALEEAAVDQETPEDQLVSFKDKKFQKINYKKRISSRITKQNKGKDSIILNKLVIEESFSELANTQVSLQNAMWADIDAYMAICNILMCLVITPLLILLLGPALGICFYPLIIFIGGIFFIEELSIYVVQYFAVAALSLNYTLYKVGSEIFYVPTDKVIKYKIKAVCDTFIFRFGDMASALVVTVFVWVMNSTGKEYSLSSLSYIVFVVVFLWIAIIYQTGKKYQKLLENQR